MAGTEKALKLLVRTEVQWTLVPALAALGLAFVPGFNILSFYFCLPMGLLLSVAAASVMITAAVRGRKDKDLIEGIRRGALHSILLTLPPLVIITVSHFINGPCDYIYGLTHYFAGPVISTVTGAGIAACCVLLFRRENRASAAFMVFLVASFIPAAFYLYFEPTVRFFNPFLGLYPGPIYDELIEVTPAYVTFRAWCLLMIAAFWMTARQIRIFRRGQARLTGWMIVAGLWTVMVLTLNGLGGFSFAIDRDDIRQELSFVRKDEYCVIHADASWQKRGQLADRLLKDCGYRHRTLSDFFGVKPGKPIDVWIYRDVRQKARLVGARHVEISKPWLNEIHVTDMMPGDMILAHEIAHVIAGRLSDNLLAMPLAGLIMPDMALVEGLAVAGAFADPGPSPHEWTVAMLRAGREIDLSSLFSPWSFISGGAAASYTTAGSFIRFIHDVHGIPAIQKLAAGKGFVAATGQELDQLKKEWLEYLEFRHSENVDRILQARAAARFSDPGVLHRRCPLDIARRLRDAMELYSIGDLKGALKKIREATAFDSDERSLKRLAARVEFLAAGGLGKPETLDAVIADVLSPPRGAATMADRTAAADLLAVRGFSDIDTARSKEFLERAASMLRDLRAILTSGGALRAICARLSAINTGGAAGLAIVRALADPRPWTEGDVDRLLLATNKDPDNAVLWHLTGRAAMQYGLFEMALFAFRKAQTAGFVEPVESSPRGEASPDNTGIKSTPCVDDFESENMRLGAISAYWAGDLESAGKYLKEARKRARFEGDRLVILEYQNRLTKPR